MAKSRCGPLRRINRVVLLKISDTSYLDYASRSVRRAIRLILQDLINDVTSVFLLYWSFTGTLPYIYYSDSFLEAYRRRGIGLILNSY